MGQGWGAGPGQGGGRFRVSPSPAGPLYFGAGGLANRHRYCSCSEWAAIFLRMFKFVEWAACFLARVQNCVWAACCWSACSHLCMGFMLLESMFKCGNGLHAVECWGAYPLDLPWMSGRWSAGPHCTCLCGLGSWIRQVQESLTDGGEGEGSVCVYVCMCAELLRCVLLLCAATATVYCYCLGAATTRWLDHYQLQLMILSGLSGVVDMAITLVITVHYQLRLLVLSGRVVDMAISRYRYRWHGH